MSRIHYRKLVRDRIPEIITQGGASCRVRRLGVSEYREALTRKVLEEARELQEAGNRRDALNELVDLHELVEALRKSWRVSPAAFAAKVQHKRRERGGFRKRLFLEYVTDRKRGERV